MVYTRVISRDSSSRHVSAQVDRDRSGGLDARGGGCESRELGSRYTAAEKFADCCMVAGQSFLTRGSDIVARLAEGRVALET